MAAAQNGVHVGEAHRAEYRHHEQHPQDESRVAHAIHHERLLAGIGRRFLVEIETDQQVAAQPHAFPADEQQDVVVGQHQHQHEEHEQVEVAEEAVVAVIVGHVADGVDVDQEADSGDHQDHHGAERIEQKAPIGLKRGHVPVGHVERHPGDPGELDDLVDAHGLLRKLPHGDGGKDKGKQHHAGADEIDQGLERRVCVVAVIVLLRAIVRGRVRMPVVFVVYRYHAGRHRELRHGLRIELFAQQQHQGRSQEREQRDQPDLVQEVHGAPTISASRFHPPARFPYCGTVRSGCPALLPPRPPRRQSRRSRISALGPGRRRAKKPPG